MGHECSSIAERRTCNEGVAESHASLLTEEYRLIKNLLCEWQDHRSGEECLQQRFLGCSQAMKTKHFNIAYSRYRRRMGSNKLTHYRILGLGRIDNDVAVEEQLSPHDLVGRGHAAAHVARRPGH